MQTSAQRRAEADDRIARDPLIGLSEATIERYAKIYLRRNYSDQVTFETFLRIALSLDKSMVRFG
jgi:hypothetical protein